MEYGSLDSREDGEYNGVSLVEILKMFVMQDTVSLEWDHSMDYSWFTIRNTGLDWGFLPQVLACRKLYS